MRIVILAVCIALTACASQVQFAKERMSDVYVKDFYSTDPTCTTSDVDLTHSGAEEFFKRSKSLDYKTLTDNYPIAPCYIMGTLLYKGKICDWKILAGSTGSIKCDAQEWFFACDTCEDLFKK